MKKRIGISLIIAGILCLAGAGGLYLHNAQENIEANDSALEALQAVYDRLPDEHITQGDDGMTLTGAMPAVEADGRSYIGIVTIPSLEIELPIQSDWSLDNAKISPCRYQGSAYDNDLIVAGHNYDRHFGRLKNLISGDEVIITDVNGNEFSYEVIYTEIIDTTGVEEMNAGEWDLTLFTCTIGGASRVTVRCAAVSTE